jgi:hypothetical protein
MNFNWKIIKQKLYGILKSPGRNIRNISMYDEKGNENIDPTAANRYFVELSSSSSDADSFKILVAIRDNGQTSSIDVKTPNVSSDDDFSQIEQLVNHIRSAIGSKEGIKVNWQQFDKEIDTREEAMHNISESKDVGKLIGTTKSSFQRIGNARLIVRHTDTVNEEKHGARTRHIRALFVENKAGERFAYPHLHMTGARAFARHISHGGSNHDNVAKNIYALSEDYLALRNAIKAVRLQEAAYKYVDPIRTSMETINRKLKSMHGPKGYANITKDFINENIIVDTAEIEKLHLALAENCQCAAEQPLWNDLGVAAKYMVQQPQTIPVEFTWSRRPDIQNYVSDNISQRMHDQIMEIAAACTNEDAAQRLREVAQLIMNGQTPAPSDLDMVKEAFASSLQFVPQKTMIPEEVEFDSYIAEFDLNNIFKEAEQRGPMVHDLSNLDDGEVYDITQTSDDIKDGDILKMSNNRAAILYRAWPTMAVGDSNVLHQLKDSSPDAWKTLDGGKYQNSYIKATTLDHDSLEEYAKAQVLNFYKALSKTTNIDDKADKIKQAEMGRYGPDIAKDVDDKMSAIAQQNKLTKDYHLEKIVDILIDNLEKGVYQHVEEDMEQDNVHALVAAGEDPNEAEKEVMDIKSESTPDYSKSAVKDADDIEFMDNASSLGYVHNYGEIIAKAGDKVLTVDEDEEYDADGELENVKLRYTVLTDLGNNKYKREDDMLNVTPYDKSNKAALDAFRKLYDTEDNDEIVDEGFWDNVKQAGKEFWHGTPEEKETERRTQMAFDKERLKKDVASGKVRITDKDGNPIDIKEDQEYLYKKLRMNPDGSVDVVGFFTAPPHSVLAGQTLKRFIDSYDSEEAAKQAHPDAEGYSSKYTDPQVSLSHLPGEDDPVSGGMYPDDIMEDDSTVPMAARQLYAQTYSKNAKTVSHSKDAALKAYAAVLGKFGKQTVDALKAHHEKNQQSDDVKEGINRLTKLAGI